MITLLQNVRIDRVAQIAVKAEEALIWKKFKMLTPITIILISNNNNILKKTSKIKIMEGTTSLRLTLCKWMITRTLVRLTTIITLMTRIQTLMEVYKLSQHLVLMAYIFLCVSTPLIER